MLPSYRPQIFSRESYECPTYSKSEKNQHAIDIIQLYYDSLIISNMGLIDIIAVFACCRVGQIIEEALIDQAHLFCQVNEVVHVF